MCAMSDPCLTEEESRVELGPMSSISDSIFVAADSSDRADLFFLLRRLQRLTNTESVM